MMATAQISNGKVTAVISDKGAELQSIAYNGSEYLWQGDPKFWNRHAPVLFPFVGRCKNDVYTYAGKVYKMGQHGFARDNVFELVNYTDSTALFCLKSNEELKKVYPFDFEFYVEYSAVGNTLQIDYRVTNKGEKAMFFSVGSHEALNCPLVAGERFEDYILTFNCPERLDRYFLEDGLVGTVSEPFVDLGQEFVLDHKTFDKGAAVLKNIKSNKVTLKSRVSGRGAEVSFDGFRNLGIWQAKDAPFLCIEPWMGISDSVQFCDDLPNKKDIVRLNTGADYNCRHTITLF